MVFIKGHLFDGENDIRPCSERNLRFAIPRTSRSPPCCIRVRMWTARDGSHICGNLLKDGLKYWHFYRLT